jgi:hypothetical protein
MAHDSPPYEAADEPINAPAPLASGTLVKGRNKGRIEGRKQVANGAGGSAPPRGTARRSVRRVAPPAGQPEQAVRCASCHSHTGQSVMPLCDSGYSVGSRHSTHSAYGGPSASGGRVASMIVR